MTEISNTQQHSDTNATPPKKPTGLNVYRHGLTVSLWRSPGARLDIDAREIADILRALGLHKHSVADAIEWGDTIEAINWPAPAEAEEKTNA